MDDLAQMGEQHGDRIDRPETPAPRVMTKARDRDRPNAECQLANFVPGGGPRSVANDDEVVGTARSWSRPPRREFDLIGPGRRLISSETDPEPRSRIGAQHAASCRCGRSLARRQQSSVEPLLKTSSISNDLSCSLIEARASALVSSSSPPSPPRRRVLLKGWRANERHKAADERECRGSPGTTPGTAIASAARRARWDSRSIGR